MQHNHLHFQYVILSEHTQLLVGLARCLRCGYWNFCLREAFSSILYTYAPAMRSHSTVDQELPDFCFNVLTASGLLLIPCVAAKKTPLSLRRLKGLLSQGGC